VTALSDRRQETQGIRCRRNGFYCQEIALEAKFMEDRCLVVIFLLEGLKLGVCELVLRSE
jgi:hypothetical protein